MRLYIWEGNDISNAYHDDGTLVVLAESPEQARAITRAHRAAHEADWDTPSWDGTDEALDREPDRELVVDVPTLVAFNGGGYD